MSMRLALLAEASNEIGTGHIVEIKALAHLFSERGGAPYIWVNSEAPYALLEGLPFSVATIPNFQSYNLESLALNIRAKHIRTVVTNFRAIQNEQVLVLKKHDIPVLCIDEWGRRHLDCDAVVNNSPITAYHAYTSTASEFKRCVGVSYLALSEDYQSIHETPRCHRGLIRSICISMGGVDRTGATIRLVSSILRYRTGIDVHVILGSGFAYRQAFEDLLASTASASVVVHENLPSLAQRFFDCDVGFTAGGNTLAELACVGTPAVVASEDPHEDEQGQAFERMGFGQWIGRGNEIDVERVHKALAQLEDANQRNRQCQIGKSLVDGKGASRILDVIEGLML